MISDPDIGDVATPDLVDVINVELSGEYIGYIRSLNSRLLVSMWAGVLAD